MKLYPCLSVSNDKPCGCRRLTLSAWAIDVDSTGQICRSSSTGRVAMIRADEGSKPSSGDRHKT